MKKILSLVVALVAFNSMAAFAQDEKEQDTKEVVVVESTSDESAE